MILGVLSVRAGADAGAHHLGAEPELDVVARAVVEDDLGEYEALDERLRGRRHSACFCRWARTTRSR